MTAHIEEIVLSGRDQERDAATDLYVSEHFRECADCRELQRKVERADRLLAAPELALPVPARATVAPARWELAEHAPRLAAFGVVALAAVAIGGALREMRQDDSVAAQPRPTLLGPSASPAAPPPLAALSPTLAGVSLGMDGGEVRAILGSPDRTSPIGVRWEYERGLILHFDSGPVDDPTGLVSIWATQAGARTGDGFAVGDTTAAFLATYGQSHGILREDPATNTYHFSGPVGRGGRLLVQATMESDRATAVLLLRDDRPYTFQPPTIAVPTSTTGADGQLVVIGPYRVDPRWREVLEEETRKRLDHLTFTPLIPDYVTYPTTPAVSAREGCGAATRRCLDFEWSVLGASIRILQGQAGCCLDAVRPNAGRDIEIRPGVLAQFSLIQPQFGGPILWWTEPTATGDVYVAISGPYLGQEELLKIARSMRPLDVSR